MSYKRKKLPTKNPKRLVVELLLESFMLRGNEKNAVKVVDVDQHQPVCIVFGKV